MVTGASSTVASAASTLGAWRFEALATAIIPSPGTYVVGALGLQDPMRYEAHSVQVGAELSGFDPGKFHNSATLTLAFPDQDDGGALASYFGGNILYDPVKPRTLYPNRRA